MPKVRPEPGHHRRCWTKCEARLRALYAKRNDHRDLAHGIYDLRGAHAERVLALWMELVPETVNNYVFRYVWWPAVQSLSALARLRRYLAIDGASRDGVILHGMVFPDRNRHAPLTDELCRVLAAELEPVQYNTFLCNLVIVHDADLAKAVSHCVVCPAELLSRFAGTYLTMPSWRADQVVRELAAAYQGTVTWEEIARMARSGGLGAPLLASRVAEPLTAHVVDALEQAYRSGRHDWHYHLYPVEIQAALADTIGRAAGPVWTEDDYYQADMHAHWKHWFTEHASDADWRKYARLGFSVTSYDEQDLRASTWRALIADGRAVPLHVLEKYGDCFTRLDYRPSFFFARLGHLWDLSKEDEVAAGLLAGRIERAIGAAVELTESTAAHFNVWCVLPEALRIAAARYMPQCPRPPALDAEREAVLEATAADVCPDVQGLVLAYLSA